MAQPCKYFRLKELVGIKFVRLGSRHNAPQPLQSPTCACSEPHPLLLYSHLTQQGHSSTFFFLFLK